MLKKLFSVSGAILLILFLFGCQQDNVVDPVTNEVNNGTLNKGVIESATGSGHIEFDGGLRVFTHNATNKANGSSGHFDLNRHDAGIHFGGSVICLNVVDNVAYFAGVIETSNSEDAPWVPGSFVIWSTIDNGEGNNAPTDEISLVYGGYTEAEAISLCESGFGVPYIEISQGNIQIR